MSFKNSTGNRCKIVAPTTSSFLATKKTAKKRVGRVLEGVNYLLTQVIHSIQNIWQPYGFKICHGSGTSQVPNLLPLAREKTSEKFLKKSW